MTKLAVVFGTRPEAIKLGPVVAALAVPFCCINTRQQSSGVFLGMPAMRDLFPSTLLSVPNMPLDVWVDNAVPELRTVLPELGTTHVVVQGDTASALAGARAASALRLPLAHIEAGIRSGNPREPWPEEMFRREIDALADLRIPATTIAHDNLVAEGLSTTAPTGNTGISALVRYSSAKPRSETDVPTILVTLHRGELLQQPDLGKLLDMLFQCIAEHVDIQFIWPVHPGMRSVLSLRDPPRNLRIVAPLSHDVCLEVLAGCRGVLTDSGGLVEEAATLGVPTAILRNVNDRPEAEHAGIAKRMDVSVEGIARAIPMLVTCELPRTPTPAFGTFDAARQVAQTLQQWMVVPALRV